MTDLHALLSPWKLSSVSTGPVSDTHIVIVAEANDDALALESIRAGASAHLSKSMHTDVVVQTIRSASAGHVTLPSIAVSRLVRDRGRHDALSERE